MSWRLRTKRIGLQMMKKRTFPENVCLEPLSRDALCPSLPQTNVLVSSPIITGANLISLEKTLHTDHLDLRLHTTKKFSPRPILQIGGVFCIDVDQESLINKIKMKNRLGLLIFCGGCADLMSLSTYLCKKKKKTFLSKIERFGSFLFGFFYSNLALPSAKSFQNGRF